MTKTTSSAGHDQRRDRAGWDVWVRHGCALVVASVAAYASYQHQREFALHGGADATSAALWPLSVDGLLVLATVGLLKSDNRSSRRVRYAVWLAFGLGIAMSLAANVAAAPRLAWQPVLVAGWPPVALLLAVELLAHRAGAREHGETGRAGTETGMASGSTDGSGQEPAPAVVPPAARQPDRRRAEEIMWEHFQRERSHGRVPTGAELDRIAGTKDYGRGVLRQWRRTGRIDPVSDHDRRNGQRLPAGTGGGGG